MARVICKGGNTGDWTVELSQERYSHTGGENFYLFIMTKPYRAQMKKNLEL